MSEFTNFIHRQKTEQPVAPPSDQSIEITHDEEDHEHEDNYRGNNNKLDDDNNV